MIKWEVHRQLNSIAILTEDHLEVIATMGFRAGDDQTEAIARATLMAQSRELLEALEALVKASPGLRTDNLAQQQIIQAADTAIAAAKVKL